MNTNIFSKSLSIFMLCVFSLSAFAEGQKKALIIAVGNYDKSSTGWNPISSENDVPLVKGALQAQGFDSKNISTITNNDASKQGILNALDQLEENAEIGDIIVVHYSGHGQQITDNNGDELDGYDEAMIPIDAHARFQKGVYEGENHIRDDEIGEKLASIRSKIGPTGSVLLIMDSCHSGTSSRGLAKTRGTQETFDTKAPNLDDATKEEGLFGLSDDVDKEKGMAPLICFYGASAHELNYEATDKDGNGVGSLSFAFSEAFSNASPTQSYEELFDQIKIKMSVLAPRQSPQAEGDLDLVILGGKIDGKKQYFNVTHVEGSIVRVNGGSLMGIYEGSEISFYPLGKEAKEENLLTKGTVSFTDATTADVELENETKGLENSKAVVTKINYGSLSVSVKLDLKDNDLKQAVETEFAKYPLINVVDHEAELLLEENNEFTRGEKLHLITAQEYELLSESYAEVSGTAKKITASVLAYAQAKYLRRVEMENEDLDLHFEFIPINAQKVGRSGWKEESRLDISEKKDASGNITFQEGDFFKIKVRNDGYEVAYYALLDFQPNNEIGVLIPGKNQKELDFKLAPGEEVELPKVFRFGPPYGTEVFKLVASKNAIPFRSILVNKGVSRGPGTSSDNPFAQMVSATLNEEQNTRGTETMNVEPGNCNIQTVSFSIIKKEND